MCACAAWNVPDSNANVLQIVALIDAIVGMILMGAICVCDIRAKTMPTKLTLLLTLMGVIYIACGWEINDIPLTLIAAAVCVLVFKAADWLMRKINGNGVGGGDVKLLPAVALFSGIPGFLVGLVAAAIVLAVYAIANIIFDKIKGNKKRAREVLASEVPMGPAFCAWLAVGILVIAI
jgi:Flp pilus assembly protein protease CpaA